MYNWSKFDWTKRRHPKFFASLLQIKNKYGRGHFECVTLTTSVEESKNKKIEHKWIVLVKLGMFWKLYLLFSLAYYYVFSCLQNV